MELKCYSTGVKILHACRGCWKAHHSAPNPPGTSGVRGAVFTSTVSASSCSACCSEVAIGVRSSSGGTTERMSGGVRFIAVGGDVFPAALSAAEVLAPDVPDALDAPDAFVGAAVVLALRHFMVSLKHTTGAAAACAGLAGTVDCAWLVGEVPAAAGPLLEAGAALAVA